MRPSLFAVLRLMNYELCSIQLQVGPEYFLDGLQRCLVRFLLVRDCSPALHARIAIGEALFCLAVHHYSICNFLKPTISCGLRIGKLERCLKLNTVKDVLSAFSVSSTFLPALRSRSTYERQRGRDT